MERYYKYLIIKNDDIEKHLSSEEVRMLDRAVNSIRFGRKKEGKQDQQYVVVAADLPIYETVLGLLEAFVDNKPNEIDQLSARVAELEAQLDTHKKLSEAAISDNARWVETLTKKLMLAKEALASASTFGAVAQKAIAAINDSKAVEGLILCDAVPRAWQRKWFADGEEPKKERNANGRLVLPSRFKFRPLTEIVVFKDDVPLYAPRRTEK